MIVGTVMGARLCLVSGPRLPVCGVVKIVPTVYACQTRASQAARRPVLILLFNGAL